MARFSLRRLPALTAGLCLLCLWSACGEGAAREPGLEWKGRSLPVSSRLEKPGADTLRALGLDRLAAHPPRRMLRIAPGEWGDSLRVLEYGNELQAYAAFQELSSEPGDAAAGFTLQGERAGFLRGGWIVVMDVWDWKGKAVFDEAIALPGAALPQGSPPAFASLLHQGRIPGSESVLTKEFLGLEIADPVFSVKMDCRGDTAWLYAAPRMPRAFAEALLRVPGWAVDSAATGLRLVLKSPEFAPVTLHFERGGMAGMEGCFDDNLTRDRLKMQIRGLKSLK